MKQITTYGVRIHAASLKPVQDMVSIYRQAVSFLIHVCDEQWNAISVFSALVRKQYVEGLVHHTKKRPFVEYEEFDRQFYKMPSYIRRAAIAEAIGAVESYRSRLKAWNENPVGKAPGVPQAGYTYPVLYAENMLVQTGEHSARIKVWLRNTWDWMDVTFRKSDADYIARHCNDRHKLCPTVVRKGRNWELMFPFEEEVTLRTVDINDQVVLAVDLGINNACACSVMRSDGTIVGRRIFRMPEQEDCLYHLLNKVKKASKQGNQHVPALWSSINNTNRRIAEETARFITRTAEEFHADVIVFEMLDISGKTKGRSKRQRLHLWKSRDVQSMVTCKAHRMGIRVSHVNAWNTSRLAFDGSGKVERSKKNYSICTFQTGKIYNCDLNASYNIGARYFIREITKTLPVTTGLGISAKVPECTRRSTCTLSTLLNLNAALAA